MDESFRARVLRRSPNFAEIAQKQLEKIPTLSSVTVYRQDSPLLLSQAYFLLSDSYKERRNQATLTDDYKKAAISAVAVMTLRPFEPIEPENVTSSAVLFANPIYALACANSWLSDRNLVAHYPFDYLKRFYLSLLRIRMPSLDHFVDSANEGLDYRAIEAISLSREETEDIEEWILKFWQLANQKR